MLGIGWTYPLEMPVTEWYLYDVVVQKEVDTFSLETKFFSIYLYMLLISFAQTSSPISPWWGLTCKGLIIKDSLLLCLEPSSWSLLTATSLFTTWEFKLTSKPELYTCHLDPLEGRLLLHPSFAFSSFLLWHYWWVFLRLALLNGMQDKLCSIPHDTALKRSRWCCYAYDGLVGFPLLSAPCTFLGVEQEEELCPSFVPRLGGDCSLQVPIFFGCHFRNFTSWFLS